jgi:ABC-type multidrug transport system fused ATPase/permease subunit
MDKGKFIESGTHKKLMKKQGKYAKLFTAQAKYYR